MATTFITAPSSATPGGTATLQNLSSASVRSSHSADVTSSTSVTSSGVSNINGLSERSGATKVINLASDASFHQPMSQFSLSAKTEVPEEAAMITIQSPAGANNNSSNVQYLTDGEGQIFAATNGQLRQYTQYVSDASPPSGTFTTSSSGGGAAGTTYYDASGLQVVQRPGSASVTPKVINANQLAGLGGMQGQLVTHQGSTYILQTGSSGMLESDGQG
jgi:hypothetical protein